VVLNSGSAFGLIFMLYSNTLMEKT